MTDAQPEAPALIRFRKSRDMITEVVVGYPSSSEVIAGPITYQVQGLTVSKEVYDLCYQAAQDARQATCRSCGRHIFWRRFYARAQPGPPMPIDAVPNQADGNIVLVAADGYKVLGRVERNRMQPGEIRYMPHHATCPQGDQWHNRKGDTNAAANTTAQT